MDAGLLDVLHDAADDDRAGRVGDRIDVELDRVLEELVDQDRMLRRRLHRRRHVAIERRHVVDDGHGAAAEHVGRAGRPAGSRSSRATSRASSGDVAVPLGACGMPRSHSSCEKRSRSSARSIESGDVPMILTPASCSGSASFSGVCPPYWTTHGDVAAGFLLARDDRGHVLERERLEVQPIDGVVVGRHRLRVAVDHHRLEPLFAQREGGVAAAVVELDALPDAVRAAAEDDDLLPRRRVGLALLSRRCRRDTA